MGVRFPPRAPTKGSCKVSMFIKNDTVKRLVPEEYKALVLATQKETTYLGESETEALASFASLREENRLDKDSNSYRTYESLLDKFWEVTGGLSLLICYTYKNRNNKKREHSIFWAIGNFPYDDFDSEYFKRVVKSVSKLL